MGLGLERWGWQHWAVAIGAALIPLGYLLSLDEVLGGWGDDAWYLVLGKALATGQGFRAISLPSPPPVPLYPPGFPVLLAVAWTACPSVSANAVCFKLVPILLSLGFSVLSYLVLRATYGIRPVFGAAVVVVTGLHPYLTSYLGSTVMSDLPYAFLSMAIILLVEGYGRSSGVVSWRLAASASLLAGLCLVRYVGISLIFASGIYLVMMRKPRKALSLCAGTAAILAPWLYFILTQPGGGDLMDGKGWRTYADNLRWINNLGMWGYLEFLGKNITDYLLRDNIPTVILPASAWVLTDGPEWSGYPRLVSTVEVLGIVAAVTVILTYLMVLRRSAISKSLHLIELYVLCYMLLVLSQPVWTPRYLLPLTPFITFYLFYAVSRLASWVMSLSGPGSDRLPELASAITVGLILALGLSHLFVNASRIYNLHWQPSAYYRQWPETLEAYRWIRSHTEPDALLAAPNPAQMYLYSERRAIYPPQSKEELRARRVDYVLDSASARTPPWLSKEASLFQPVFTSAGGKVSVFRVEMTGAFKPAPLGAYASDLRVGE